MNKTIGLLSAAVLAGGLGPATPSVDNAQEVNPDGIVARCAEAMGYGPNLQGLSTLTFRRRTVGEDRIMEWQIVRPNLVRKEWDDGVELVFDGSRAGFLAGPRRDDGTLEGPHLVPEEDWHHFEIDVALYVPAFFDHPTKHLGLAEEDGVQVHRLGVTLPMGGEVVYSVSTHTHLLTRIRIPDWDYEIVPEAWSEVGGITMFHSYRSSSDPSLETVLEEVRVNLPLDRLRFAFSVWR